MEGVRKAICGKEQRLWTPRRVGSSLILQVPVVRRAAGREPGRPVRQASCGPGCVLTFLTDCSAISQIHLAPPSEMDVYEPL